MGKVVPKIVIVKPATSRPSHLVVSALGKKHSEETKRKMSLTAMGNARAKGKKYNLSESQIEAKRHRMLSNTLTRGITLTSEHRQKIAEAHLRIGDKTSARMQCNNLRLGIKHSEETKQKMREGHARRKALLQQK